MRIVKLTAENLKRLKAVEITPDGNTVVIAGRNAQGKSSVLDAIWMALAGAAGAKETVRPIRDGERHASVVVDLGDMVVTRQWTEKGTTLQVASRDGAHYPSPQAILDGLIGRLTFDPLAFAQQPPKEQLATLLSVVELPFVPAELDAQRRGVFDQRTEINRDVKALEAQLAGVPQVPDDTPEAEVSAAAIAAELEHTRQQARDREAAKEKYTRSLEQVARSRDVVARLERELEDARAVLAAEENVAAELLAAGQALPKPVDAAPIMERLAAVDVVNEHVRRKAERARLVKLLDGSRKVAAELSDALHEIDRSKVAAIEAAEMPLEGLSFDEDGVLYQGVPFSQASAAERLRVGIAIAMALNPQIRVIRITDGSLLDSENLALIDEMAGQHDFQIWLERVDETGTVGITIEDGAVAARMPDVDMAAAKDAELGGRVGMAVSS